MILVFQIILEIVFIHLCQGGVHQKRLINQLLRDYNHLERPVKHENESVQVLTGIAIQQIVDIEEKRQIIVFRGWLHMKWKDYHLKWNPKEYGGITKLRLPSNLIWIPADESFDTISRVNVIIEYNGDVSYLPPGIFKSLTLNNFDLTYLTLIFSLYEQKNKGTCLIQVKEFPFDDQICQLKYGSWSFDDALVNVTNISDSGNLDAYTKNGEWFLKGIKSYSESISYDCCPENYSFVMFEIHLRRRKKFLMMNLIFPCAIISVITLFGFFLPPESNEKIGFEVALLLSIIMFFEMTHKIIPESSLSLSKIGLYFGSIMMVTALSIASNVIVLVFHFRNLKINKKIPKWIDIYVCGYLAEVFGMKFPRRYERLKKNSLIAKRFIFQEEYLNLQNDPHGSRDLTKNDMFNTLDKSLLGPQLKRILKCISLISRKIKNEEKIEKNSLKWKFFAMIIDRMCAVIFSLMVLTLTTTILFSSENFFASSDPHQKF